MSPSLAASLPGPVPPSATHAATPVPPAGGYERVQCGFCLVFGPSSQIPELAGVRRCADPEACVKRWAAEGQPMPLVPLTATPPEPLPQRVPGTAPLVAEDEPRPEPVVPSDDDIDKHLAVFHAEHDEQDKREGAAPEAVPETRSEDEEPAKDSEPDPVAEPEAPEDDDGQGDA